MARKQRIQEGPVKRGGLKPTSDKVRLPWEPEVVNAQEEEERAARERIRKVTGGPAAPPYMDGLVDLAVATASRSRDLTQRLALRTRRLFGAEKWAGIACVGGDDAVVLSDDAGQFQLVEQALREIDLNQRQCEAFIAEL